ncbi:hypothetical protein V5O48_014232 [Marasmius crinis-equi]|uniref:Heme haloperoxidase family profile domain-containing protein n=1 Tax=Marasmius crinis-equi TaxID=585013 RepID=A0ABR3EY86_9AGAR
MFGIKSLFTSLLVVVQLMTITATSESLGHSPDKEEHIHAFQKPSASDSRSPCPWINALANHGYISRNGRNITIGAMLDAVEDGFGLSRDVIAIFAKQSIGCSKQYDSFDLGDTSLHGCIEHDASVSRADQALGDNTRFNETVYNTLASKNPGKDFYDISVAAQVMQERLNHSIAFNKELVNGEKEFGHRSAEAALYLMVMGDPESAVAPKKYVDVIFREDRMPWAEGWRKSSKLIQPAAVQAVVPKIMEAANWKATGGAYPGAIPIVYA